MFQRSSFLKLSIFGCFAFLAQFILISPSLGQQKELHNFEDFFPSKGLSNVSTPTRKAPPASAPAKTQPAKAPAKSNLPPPAKNLEPAQATHSLQKPEPAPATKPASTSSWRSFFQTTSGSEKQKTDAGTTVLCENCPQNSTSRSLVDSTAIANHAMISQKLGPRKRIPTLKLPAGSTSQVKTGTADANVWKNHPEVIGYSESQKVANMIRVGIPKNERPRGQCYAHVKDDLFHPQVKLTSHRLVAKRVFPNKRKWPGDFGKGAIENFQDDGFKNLLTDPATKDLIKSPYDAPKGAVLIYTGGKNGGHIEIKSDYANKGKFFSDYQRGIPIPQLFPRDNYKLVGVMIRPMGTAQ